MPNKHNRRQFIKRTAVAAGAVAAGLHVPIACNYHPWESAYILPLDHPYVDITKMDGTFRIPKLPVGKLEFQVWHEKIGYLSTPEWKKGRFKMTVKPGINDLGAIKIDAALLAK